MFLIKMCSMYQYFDAKFAQDIPLSTPSISNVSIGLLSSYFKDYISENVDEVKP